MLFQKLLQFLRGWRQDLRARAAKYFVTQQVIKVLQLTHAQELAEAPRNEWAIVRSRQVMEIKAVRDGQAFDIVDRRSWAYPYLPEALHRLNQPVLKNTPYNLRRFSETPIPRRAMNLVKNAVLSFKWEIKPTSDYSDDVDPEREQRIRIATEALKRPNNTGESFRDLLEQMCEDFLLNGAGCAEHRLTPYAKRPFKVWAVDSSTVRIFLDWTESTPDRPRYAQMTGLKGERGIVTFLTDELMYVRDNIRTATPFGLGRLEICFKTVNSFLGVQDMSGKAGADQVHKTWLWWENTLNPAHINLIRRHITNEIEGQAKVSMVAGAKAPQVISVQAVNPEDLLLDWQKFLIQLIATGFDLSPQALGLDEHPNRATAQVMSDQDWRSAVVPVATRFQQAFTRQLLHDLLGWKDLEFEFIGLEDPDLMVRTVIHQRLYMMNAITPDEIRKKNNLPKLPGPWGRLTQGQLQLMIAEATAMLGGAKAGASAGMGGGMGGMGGGMRSGGAGASSGLGSSSMGLGSSMNFTAMDISEMQPDEIQLYQELGILPDSMTLMQEMDQQQPGILEQLSDELSSFFEKEKLKKEADTVEPSPITKEQEDIQIQKFLEDSHQESLAEKTINRRGTLGPAINDQVRKNPERGKYPRSGGRYIDQQGKDRVLDTGAPKKRLRPGKNNPYQ